MMFKTILVSALATFAVAAIAITITLTPDQLNNIAAQQGGGPVPVPVPVPVPPPTGSCPGFAKTLNIPIVWANPTRMLTSSFGGFGPNDIAVVSFTTGTGPSAANNLPRIAGAEYGAGAANRIAALSDQACSFTALPGWGSSVTSSAVTIPFNVVTPDPWGGFYSVLKANTTYYLNVKQAPNSGCTVSCDMFFDLSRNGTP